ncbi:MAG: acyl-homoserine-lactone synthase [Rhizobiaceae bacterium]
MIIYIPQSERNNHRNLLDQYFFLRRKIFCDTNQWVTPDEDGKETDFLDLQYNVYILYLDENSNSIAGGVRLAPTTGETLVHSVWADMLPDPDDFRSPNIWEATRFCVDDDTNASRNGNFVNRVCLALVLGILDFAAENGISSIIAVCEQRVVDLLAVFRTTPDVISIKTEADGCEIACVMWSVDEELINSLSWARGFIGGTGPVKLGHN